MLHVEGDLVAGLQQRVAHALPVHLHVGGSVAQHGLAVDCLDQCMLRSDARAVDAQVGPIHPVGGKGRFQVVRLIRLRF